MKPLSNVVIRASAGSGKTFQLSNRYIELLCADVPAEQILAVTFTRKAAGEILQRIVLRLAEAAVDERRCAQLAGALRQSKPTAQQCLEILANLLQQLHRVAVGTLDSFFAQIASSFTLELGLPPGWRIVEEHQDAQLRSLAVETILRGDSTAEVSRLMNLITKGDAERSVSELVHTTVNRLYGLYQQTSAEAWRRFPREKPLNEQQEASVVSQLKSAALPENRHFHNARDADYENASQGDWEAFLGKGIAAKLLAGSRQYYRVAIPVDLASIYQTLIAHARNVLISQLAKQTEATYELLRKFDAVYQQLKYNARALRFDDVTRQLGDLARIGDIERWEFRLDARIAHLLIDEFQDTSLLQWRIVRPLAERAAADPPADRLFGRDGSLLCVGDVKQAIYGWRGGKSEIFDALESQLPGVQREALTHSYRSAPEVISAVNRIFQNIAAHPNLEKLSPAVERWSSEFPRHSTARTELAGYVSLTTAAAARQGEKQTFATLRFAAERIAELIKQAPGRSLGVLTRKNSTVAQLIYLLRRLDVRASEEGGSPLTDSPAVQAVLSLLLLADHPGDEVARFHVASGPLGPIVGIRPAARADAVRRVAQSIRRDLMVHGYGPSVYDWSRALSEFCDRRDASRLQQLVELAYDYQSLATLRPHDFVRFVQQQRVSDPTVADVRVMTIHQAKGLQFDIVVLPELDEPIVGQAGSCVVAQQDPTAPIDRVCMHRNATIQSVLPDDLQAMFRDAIHQQTVESLCVLYVAVTRAAHALHLIVAPSKASERQVHKTYAGLLRAALVGGQPVEPETRLFELGDPAWSAKAGDPRQAQAEQAPPSPRPVRIRLAAMPDGRRVGLARAAPSSLEGGSVLAMENLLRIGNRGAMTRGTLIHAWFEQIQWLDEHRPTELQLRRAAERLDVEGISLQAALEDFTAYLAAPSVAELLTRSSYLGLLPPALRDDLSDPLELAVYNERRFAVHAATGILAGTIDRLVLVRHRGQPLAADVIDYKTDLVDEGNQHAKERLLEHYAPQLQAYRIAVGKMFGLETDRVSARIVLLSRGEVAELGSQYA